jgi:hypothetical protein
MIDKISDAAEKLATSISTSRRGFFAQVGKAGLAVIGALAGLALLTQGAQAARPFCCQYAVPSHFCGVLMVRHCRQCPATATFGGVVCNLISCKPCP